VAREFLESAGYTVLQAASGSAALHVAATHDGIIDLLITDMVMPGMSGQELVRRMCEERRQLRIIYMSGYSDATGAAASGEGGPIVLTKPFSRSALLQAVRQALQSK